MSETRIGHDSEVTLHFTVKLPNGEVVDSTADKSPATFKVGDGNLLPGFEQSLFGLKAGDQRTFEIEPSTASVQAIRRTSRRSRAASSMKWSSNPACW